MMLIQHLYGFTADTVYLVPGAAVPRRAARLVDGARSGSAAPSS